MQNKTTFWVQIGVVIILALFSWISVANSLYGNPSSHWLGPIIFFYLWLCAFSLFGIVNSRNKNLVKLVLMASFVPALGLGFKQWYAMILFVAFAWLVGYWSVRNMMAKINNYIKIDVVAAIRYGLPLMITAVSFLISIGVYLAIKSDNSSLGAIKINIAPASMIEKTITASAAFIPQPEIKLIADGATVDQFIDSSISSGGDIISSEVDQYISDLEKQYNRKFTPQERMRVQQQLKQSNGAETTAAREEIRKQLGKQFETDNLKGDEKMVTVVSDYISKRINALVNNENNGGALLPLGIALALFFTLKSLGWLLLFPLIWTCQLIFFILFRLGIIKVQTQMKEVEELGY